MIKIDQNLFSEVTIIFCVLEHIPKYTMNVFSRRYIPVYNHSPSKLQNTNEFYLKNNEIIYYVFEEIMAYNYT